jgi:hypothetical protein
VTGDAGRKFQFLGSAVNGADHFRYRHKTEEKPNLESRSAKYVVGKVANFSDGSVGPAKMPLD